MEGHKITSLSGQLKALVAANKDFSQKLKQRLISESSKVENPFKFVVELFGEGVLCDGSNNLDAHFGFKEMLVQLAVTIGCSKGADGIDGLVKAMESSGNFQLLSGLQTWAKKDLGIESDNDSDPSEPEAGTSAFKSPPRKKLRRNVTSSTELSLSGAKLVIRIMSHMEEDGFMEQLEAHLVAKAPEIVHPTEFSASLLHQNVLEENDVTTATRQKTRSVAKLATGPQAKERQQIERALKAACSKKAIGPLVVALENSNNERILLVTHDWLETFLTRKKNRRIAFEILARQPIYGHDGYNHFNSAVTRRPIWIGKKSPCVYAKRAKSSVPDSVQEFPVEKKYKIDPAKHLEIMKKAENLQANNLYFISTVLQK